MKQICYVFAVLLLSLSIPSTAMTNDDMQPYNDPVLAHSDSTWALIGSTPCSEATRDWVVNAVIRYYDGYINKPTVMKYVVRYFECTPP